MAAFNKFNIFVQNVGRGVHNLNSDTLKDMLSNTAPVATNALLSDITEIAAGNGYSAGGTTVGSTAYSQTSGTATLSGANVVFTASGGSIGPFRYVVNYDSTPTSPLKPLIGWWDYGSSITLASGETFTVDHSANILTIA
jgi:hypothetical protein